MGAVSGTSVALESSEAIFNQDLNGDGVIGLNPIVIATDTNAFGSTSLAQFGNNYFLYAAGGTIGPDVTINGTAVVAGTLGGWTPIGAAQTANGYEIAWKLPGNNLFTVWNTDSNGNYVSDPMGAVPGTSVALEAAESSFNQDLNGDGVIGLKPIVMASTTSALGSTALVQLGNNYFLYTAAGTTGPELKINGTDVVAGTLGGWTPIGAVQTASGYEVALEPSGQQSLYGLEHRQQWQLRVRYDRRGVRNEHRFGTGRDHFRSGFQWRRHRRTIRWVRHGLAG